MPSKEDYKTLKTHVKTNKLEEVKKMLQRDDAKALLEMTDASGYIVLMHACVNDDNFSVIHKAMSLDMIKLLCTEIKRIGGKTFLKEQLTLTTAGWNRLMDVCRYSPSHEIIQFVIDTILDVGGHGFLREQLEVKNINHKTTSFSTACCNPSITTESLVLLCSLLFESGIFKKQYDELDDSRKNILKRDGIDASWSPVKHFSKLLKSSPKDAIAYFKSLFVSAPNSAAATLNGELSSRPLTMCTLLLEHGLFKDQFSSLTRTSKMQLANNGIDSSWTPAKRFNTLLKSNPQDALAFFNVLCKYTADPCLSFLNDKVLHSEQLLNIFAAPSFVNYLAKLKIDGSLPIELHDVYDILDRKTREKIDLIKKHQEPVRKQILQEALDDTRTLRQQSFHDLAVCVHEDALKSSLEEFRNLYFDFFKKKIEIEQEAAHRELVQIETQQMCLLMHHGLVESLSIKRTHFITKSANTLRRRSVNILKTAPLRRVAKKHNMPLSENIIQKLIKESVMETGEFELLDKSRLDEMGIGKEDRLKILRLVHRHKDEALIDLRTRTGLQAKLFSLQQEKTNLVSQIEDSALRRRLHQEKMNITIKADSTSAELEQAINELEDQILELHRSIDAPELLLSQVQLTRAQLFQHAQGHQTPDNNKHKLEDDLSERSSLTSSDQSRYKVEVEQEQVKQKSKAKYAKKAKSHYSSFSK